MEEKPFRETANGLEQIVPINEKHGEVKCWEFMKCGREQGGTRVKQAGPCPAYPDEGRFCWAVTGTLCGGRPQGTFAQKRLTCTTCNFFLRVREEEGEDFVFLKDEDQLEHEQP